LGKSKIMLRKFFILSLLITTICGIGSIFAQDKHVIDSLKKVIATAEAKCKGKPCPADTGKISAYIAWGDIYLYSIPDTAMIYYFKAKEIAEKYLAAYPPTQLANTTKKYLAAALNNIGYIYSNQGDIPKALEYYGRSLKIEEEIGDKKGMASSFNNIGVIYDNQGDISKALEYYGKSLKIKEEIGDKKGMATSLNNIGSLYLENNDIYRAKSYIEKGYKIRTELGYPENIKSSALFLKYICIAEDSFENSDTLAVEVININNKSILSNFTTLLESGQEKYFKTVAENYMDFNSYALFRSKKTPSIIDVVYNNTIKNKGLLLKSSTAMRNAVFKLQRYTSYR
jgi:tetratricopeptide (TPR) repeat protein